MIVRNARRWILHHSRALRRFPSCREKNVRDCGEWAGSRKWRPGGQGMWRQGVVTGTATGFARQASEESGKPPRDPGIRGRAGILASSLPGGFMFLRPSRTHSVSPQRSRIVITHYYLVRRFEMVRKLLMALGCCRDSFRGQFAHC